MNTRRRLTREQWRELLAQQRASGLTVAEFCRRRDLAPVTFFVWRRRLAAGATAGLGQAGASPSSAAGPAFVELTTQPEPASPAAAAALTSSGVEVLLPSGVRLQVLAGFDPRTLRQVAEALS